MGLVDCRRPPRWRQAKTTAQQKRGQAAEARRRRRSRPGTRKPRSRRSRRPRRCRTRPPSMPTRSTILLPGQRRRAETIPRPPRPCEAAAQRQLHARGQRGPAGAHRCKRSTTRSRTTTRRSSSASAPSRAARPARRTRTSSRQSYYLKGDWKDTLKFEDALVDTEVKAGQTPKDQQLALVLSACVKLEDAACQHACARAHGDLLPEARVLEAAAVQRCARTPPATMPPPCRPIA